MAARRKPEEDSDTPRLPPARTPEARENQLISLATDLAEDQMRKGTASAQVISHYLKLGSSREKLEQHRIALENELLVQKTEALKAAARIEELYSAAMDAFRGYRGQESTETEDDYYED